MLRVLIVEDTPSRAEKLRRCYQGHEVVVVATGEEAVTLIGGQRFDVISLDFDLAGEMKGAEVAAALDGSPSHSSVVIIHSMNPVGVEQILAVRPSSFVLPANRMNYRNRDYRALQTALAGELPISWKSVFGKIGTDGASS